MPRCFISSLFLASLVAYATGFQQPVGTSCDCLSWADIFARKEVVCGQALEFLYSRVRAGHLRTPSVLLAADARQIDAQARAQVCDQFFEKFEGNQCVNKLKNLSPIDARARNAGSWCYVASECPNKLLRGGAPVPGTRLSWKTCQAGQDEILRDMPQMDIMDAASDYDLDASFLFENAYFTVQKDPAGMSERELLEVERTKLPTLIMPPATWGARLLIKGGQRWTLEENGEHREDDHPGTFWSWRCTAGCD